MTKGTILIVEDNHEFQKIYGDRLMMDGYEVVEAGNGEEGLAKMREKPVHIVMTDLNMPVMDGFQMIKAMKEDEALSRIPVIIMSVFDTPEQISRARSLGADDYLIKGTQTPKDVSERVAAQMAAQQPVPPPAPAA